MHAEIKKQTFTLSNIQAEFWNNRQGKLMFRTVVKSFFLEEQTDGRTDRHRELRHKVFFSEEKNNAKNLY